MGFFPIYSGFSSLFFKSALKGALKENASKKALGNTFLSNYIL